MQFVSKASAHFFPANTLSCFTNFLPDQVNLEGQWEVVFSELCYTSMYQIVTEEKFMFFDQKLSKSSEIYFLRPGLYSSITDIAEAMNTPI